MMPTPLPDPATRNSRLQDSDSDPGPDAIARQRALFALGLSPRGRRHLNRIVGRITRRAMPIAELVSAGIQQAFQAQVARLSASMNSAILRTDRLAAINSSRVGVSTP